MASSPVSRPLLTIEEYLALPPDPLGRKMELVDGYLVIEGEGDDMPGPGRLHGRLITRIASSLTTFVEAEHLGEVLTGTAFVLGQLASRARIPDVAYLRQDAIGGGMIEAVSGPPTLAVEVISPSEKMYDVREKVREYLDAGAERVWVVLPVSAEVYVYRSGVTAFFRGMDDVLTSDDAAFDAPGFQLPLRDLFA